MQVAEQAEELAQFTHLKIATITGGGRIKIMGKYLIQIRIS